MLWSSLTFFTGCQVIGAGIGFGDYVSRDQQREGKEKMGQGVHLIKLRNPASREVVWCKDDWTTRMWLPWGDEVHLCKAFYLERGFFPVAFLISHVGWIVDINAAQEEDLVEFFKGLHFSEAKAIVNGQPYLAQDELTERGILTPSSYDLVKSKIIVGPPIAIKPTSQTRNFQDQR